MSLEASGETGWDQFATNERMYGVSSTYDENIYTTAIDRNNPQYRRREAEAARIAREMEDAEKRRRDADTGDGLDEEDKYSGVRREAAVQLPKRGAGSYIPPSQRPISSTPTVQGAPFDPAIISSQLAKPAPPAPVPAVAAPEKATEPAPAPAAPVTEQLKPQAAETATRDTSVPATASSQTPKRPTEQTAEDHMRKTADAFKEFANMEKLKARQAQEAKRAGVKQEKNVRLNDLKKFAANFKLNTRVPDDLVPILAKNREKQAEIQNKAEEAAKEAEIKAEEKKKDKAADATPPAPSSATSQAQSGATPVPDPRLPFNNHSRARVSQQMRAPLLPGQGQSPRAPLSQRLQQNQHYGRGAIPPPQPLPADLRIPTGPAIPASDRAPLSPTSATRLNVNAFEFRPAASNFTPSGTTPSPQRTTNEMEIAAAPAASASSASSEASASFFGKDKKPVPVKDRKDIESSFNPIKRMLSEEHPEEHKKPIAANGGIPQPYRTPPTWNVSAENANVSYRDSFPKSQAPSQGPSPLHTPNTNGPMPHAHQLPIHLQAPQISTPQQRQPFYAQPHHGQAPAFDPRMQQFGPGGSLQSSPRFHPANPAFNGQMPHMQMPQFAGQPMPHFGMSPSMGHRQPQVMPGAPMMMPVQQYGQSTFDQTPHGLYVPNSIPVPQMRGQGFPPQGPQFGGPQMGGQMMVPNHSGGYLNGPIPQQQQQQPYSPMPPHAQPHLPHNMQGHGAPGGGYAGSPRPTMMQHQGSHQGFQPHQSQMQQHTQQPPFAPSQGQPHPYHYQQQRQMSGQQFPQMTPRQQQAVPQHNSPGMGGGVGQGDEGK